MNRYLIKRGVTEEELRSSVRQNEAIIFPVIAMRHTGNKGWVCYRENGEEVGVNFQPFEVNSDDRHIHAKGWARILTSTRTAQVLVECEFPKSGGDSYMEVVDTE